MNGKENKHGRPYKMMHETLRCNACENPGSIETAREVKAIRCNVRKFGNESFTVWRCSNCGSLHCREAVELDRYYADYPMRHQKQDFATRCANRNRLRLMCRQGLQRNHSILDYGCGTGMFINFLNAQGFDAAGYDPYVPEYSDRTVLNREFDFVTSQDVIEHVAEPRELVQTYAKLLKKGGMLFVGTPNASEIELTDEFSMELHQPYHQHILSEAALIEMFKRAGLQLIALHHRFYFDTPYPMVNTQFIKRYIRKTGGFLDAGFEEPKVGLVLSSLELLYFGLLGYLFPARGNMVGIFRRIE